MEGATVTGWSGLLLAYSAVQVPMMTTLIRHRARAHALLASPVIGLPLTAVAGLGIAAVTPLVRGLGLGGGLVQLSLGVSVCAAVGYGAARVVLRRPAATSIYQRGTLIQEIESAPHSGRHATQSEDAAASRNAAVAGMSGRLDHTRRRSSRAQVVTLAGIAVPPIDETKHFKVIGTTGTGKSTAIRELLSGALARGDRAIIADPDGGYLARFKDARRGDLVLNPFDADSRRWDLFGEIGNAYDVDQLARSLLPDHSGSDRSWTAYARTFFCAVTRQAHEAGVKDIAELYRLLVVADTGELRSFLAGTPAQPFLQEHNGRMFDSIRSVTSSAVGSLEYIAEQKGARPLAVRQWVRDGNATKANERPAGVLFIPYRAGQIAALRSTVSAWLRLAIFEAMSQPEVDQRLWFVVDELDALGQIDGLKDALARLRKFGGRCVLGFQSIAQVSSTYGSGEAQTIVENCGNTLILRCSGSDHGGTANFASRLIGQREILRVSRSRSRRPTELLASTTLSEHVGIEPAVMDSQIEQLPDLSGYLKFASAAQWRRVTLSPPETLESAAIRTDAPSPWHRWRDARMNSKGQDAGTAAADAPATHGRARGEDRGDRQRNAQANGGMECE